MQNEMLVTNIQRMCFHDGPGIRTTVFLKGCSLHCPWCSNPENIKFMPEVYEMDGIKKVYGMKYCAEDIIYQLMKDKKFWVKDGGVTFSGGETLLQAEALQEVLKQIKSRGVHTVVETALFVPEKNVDKVLSYVDEFIVDVKILDRDKCREVLGGDISDYFRNVETLFKKGKLKLFRVPCCPEYTFTEKNKMALLEFFQRYVSVPVQIFKIHMLGEKKYESLGRPMWKSKGIVEEDLYDYCRLLVRHGLKAEVIHI